MSLTLTTELEAVNAMLATIGQSPISTLQVVGSVNVAVAKEILKEVSREVQEKGWEFNREEDYPLLPDQDGFIVIPSNALRVDACDPSDKLVERAGKLYDRYKHTFTFTQKKLVNVVFGYDFEALPQAARHYIMIRAARRFGDRMIGADAMHAYTQQDELDAKAALEGSDAENADVSIFDAFDVATILDR